MNSQLEKSLKYLKEKYNINSIDQWRKEMSNIELDIGPFTMPYTIKQKKNISEK